ncbi:hypothetical protein AAMO2058_000534700 [Amorphochlora amoebiformis]
MQGDRKSQNKSMLRTRLCKANLFDFTQSNSRKNLPICRLPSAREEGAMTKDLGATGRSASFSEAPAPSKITKSELLAQACGMVESLLGLFEQYDSTVDQKAPMKEVMFNTGLMLRQAITGMGIDNSQASNTNEMLESMLSRQTYISDALKRLGSNVEGTNYTFKAYMHQKWVSFRGTIKLNSLWLVPLQSTSREPEQSFEIDLTSDIKIIKVDVHSCKHPELTLIYNRGKQELRIRMESFMAQESFVQHLHQYQYVTQVNAIVETMPFSIKRQVHCKIDKRGTVFRRGKMILTPEDDKSVRMDRTSSSNASIQSIESVTFMDDKDGEGLVLLRNFDLRRLFKASVTKIQFRTRQTAKSVVEVCIGSNTTRDEVVIEKVNGDGKTSSRETWAGGMLCAWCSDSTTHETEMFLSRDKGEGGGHISKRKIAFKSAIEQREFCRMIKLMKQRQATVPSLANQRQIRSMLYIHEALNHSQIKKLNKMRKRKLLEHTPPPSPSLPTLSTKVTSPRALARVSVGSALTGAGAGLFSLFKMLAVKFPDHPHIHDLARTARGDPMNPKLSQDLKSKLNGDVKKISPTEGPPSSRSGRTRVMSFENAGLNACMDHVLRFLVRILHGNAPSLGKGKDAMGKPITACLIPNEKISCRCRTKDCLLLLIRALRQGNVMQSLGDIIESPDTSTDLRCWGVKAMYLVSSRVASSCTTPLPDYWVGPLIKEAESSNTYFPYHLRRLVTRHALRDEHIFDVFFEILLGAMSTEVSHANPRNFYAKFGYVEALPIILYGLVGMRIEFVRRTLRKIIVLVSSRTNNAKILLQHSPGIWQRWMLPVLLYACRDVAENKSRVDSAEQDKKWLSQVRDVTPGGTPQSTPRSSTRKQKARSAETRATALALSLKDALHTSPQDIKDSVKGDVKDGQRQIPNPVTTQMRASHRRSPSSRGRRHTRKLSPARQTDQEQEGEQLERVLSLGENELKEAIKGGQRTSGGVASLTPRASGSRRHSQDSIVSLRGFLRGPHPSERKEPTISLRGFLRGVTPPQSPASKVRISVYNSPARQLKNPPPSPAFTPMSTSQQPRAVSDIPRPAPQTINKAQLKSFKSEAKMKTSFSPPRASRHVRRHSAEPGLRRGENRRGVYTYFEGEGDREVIDPMVGIFALLHRKDMQLCPKSGELQLMITLRMLQETVGRIHPRKCLDLACYMLTSTMNAFTHPSANLVSTPHSAPVWNNLARFLRIVLDLVECRYHTYREACNHGLSESIQSSWDTRCDIHLLEGATNLLAFTEGHHNPEFKVLSKTTIKLKLLLHTFPDTLDKLKQFLASSRVRDANKIGSDFRVILRYLLFGRFPVMSEMELASKYQKPMGGAIIHSTIHNILQYKTRFSRFEQWPNAQRVLLDCVTNIKELSKKLFKAKSGASNAASLLSQKFSKATLSHGRHKSMATEGSARKNGTLPGRSRNYYTSMPGLERRKGRAKSPQKGKKKKNVSRPRSPNKSPNSTLARQQAHKILNIPDSPTSPLSAAGLKSGKTDLSVSIRTISPFSSVRSPRSRSRSAYNSYKAPK